MATNFKEIADKWEKRQRRSFIISMSIFGTGLILFVIAWTYGMCFQWKLLSLWLSLAK